MKRTKVQTTVMLIIGALSLLYLINPGFGVFELIPDNIPLIGNLDEVTATILLLGVLRYFGVTFEALRKR